MDSSEPPPQQAEVLLRSLLIYPTPLCLPPLLSSPLRPGLLCVVLTDTMLIDDDDTAQSDVSIREEVRLKEKGNVGRDRDQRAKRETTRARVTVKRERTEQGSHGDRSLSVQKVKADREREREAQTVEEVPALCPLLAPLFRFPERSALVQHISHWRTALRRQIHQFPQGKEERRVFGGGERRRTQTCLCTAVVFSFLLCLPASSRAATFLAIALGCDGCRVRQC